MEQEKHELASKAIEYLAWFFVLQFANYALQKFKSLLTSSETEGSNSDETLCQN